MSDKKKRISETNSASDDERDTDESLANDRVVTKYSTAADIVNSVLKEVLSAVKEGVEVGTLCDLGDRLINEKASKVFKKGKETSKGIAMPTCVSINNCICHFSPLRSDPPVILERDQLVKIDLGAHIDGFIATAAHTVVVGASEKEKISGPKARVMLAAYNAMEMALRMLRPGKYKNMDITAMIDKVAAIYQVKPIENMLSHELKRNKIDGEKQIIQNPGEKQRADITKCQFGQYEAFAIDIIMSTGDGKTRDLDTRTTVFKKSEDTVYSLKMKASRAFHFTAVNKHGSMPFTLRSFEDEIQAKMGVVECERHSLMCPYQVLYDREGEFVAQFKSTVLVMPGHTMKIAGLPLDMNLFDCDIRIEDPAILSILNASLKPKKPKKKSAAAEDKKIESSAPKDDICVDTKPACFPTCELTEAEANEESTL